MKMLVITLIIGIIASLNVYSQKTDSVLFDTDLSFFLNIHYPANYLTKKDLLKIPKLSSITMDKKSFDLVGDLSTILFNGIAYKSVIDQLTVNSPFDIRGYRASTVTDYNRFIEKNYFLLQDPNLQRWLGW